MLLHCDDIDEGQLINPEHAAEWQKTVVSTRTTFSDFGTRLSAFEQQKPFASWVVRKMGFNLAKAAWDLRSLGMIYGNDGEGHKGNRFNEMGAALKFQIHLKQR